MSEKITMQHIADAVGVSKYVVSKSLSGKPGVNPATRERVRQAAARLGYRFHARGDALAEADQPDADKAAVVVLLPNIRFQVRESDYWGRIVNGVTEELEALGLSGIVISDQTVDSFLSIVQKDNLRGFIGIGEIAEKVLQEVSRLRVPLVLVDHDDPLVSADKLFANNREAVYQLTNHLIALNHKELRFVGNPHYAKSFNSRFSGFKEALVEHNLAVPSASDPFLSLQGPSRQEHTAEIRSVLERERLSGKLPTALVCANDAIAIAAMNALRELEISVPEQISITGFDNIEDSYQTVPRLTTVNVEKEMLGRRAAQLLHGRLREKDFPMETVYVSTSPVYRESTAELDQAQEEIK